MKWKMENYDIRNPDGTLIFDNKLNWVEYESPSFTFKHLNNHTIKNDIDLIAENRERAYKYISNFLDIQHKARFTIYIVPDFKYAHTFGFPTACSVPHENVACIVYNDFPFCPEKIAYGHEITHLLVFCWDKQIYHLEFLEEGLATYLDMSGADHHLSFLKKMQGKLTSKAVDLSLDVSPVSYRTDYEKAASFVKFLIENYGIEKFKDLYIASKLDRKGTVFFNGTKKLNKNHLKHFLQKVYRKRSVTMQKEWLENLGIIL